MPADEMIPIAIIGCGRMGVTHSQRIAADGRGRVVALFDENQSAAQHLSTNEAPGATVYDSLDQLLNHDGIQAAIICTPTTCHYEQVRAVLDREWHVLCEKPLAESGERTDAMIRWAEEATVVCMLAYQRRFWSEYRTLRREVASETWGEIQAVTSHNVERWQQTISETWRDDPHINIGGFVGDAGNHKLDILHYVTGLDVKTVRAQSASCGSNVQIQTALTGSLSSGALLAMDFIGNAQHLSEDFHVHCQHADLLVRQKTVSVAQNNTVWELENPEPDSNPVIGFLDTIQGAATNLAPFSAARPVWKLLRAIRQSSESGQFVPVSE